MTLKQMEYFLNICRYGKISRAAAETFVSPQALSKAISELEAELRVPLFQRSQHGMTLTEYGECLRSELEEIFPRLQAIPDRLKSIKDKKRETIRTVISYGVTSALSPDAWITFQREHPEYDLTILDYPDTRCEELLEKGEVDFLCGIGPLDGNRFHRKRIRSEGMYVCISDKHPLYAKPVISPEDYRDCEFLTMSPQFHCRENLVRACRKFGFEPQFAFSSNEFILLFTMMQQGRGLFVVPEHVITPTMSNVRFERFPDLTWDIYVAVSQQKPLTPGCSALWQYLTELGEGRKPVAGGK